MVFPYLTFAGNCQDALNFYGKVFHAPILMLQHYGDYIPEGVTNPPENLPNWILHAEMPICGTGFWFADEIAEPVSCGTAIKLTITVATKKQAQEIFDKLCVQGRITLPPTTTFYSAFHAALVDQFGVCWNITAEEQPVPEA